MLKGNRFGLTVAMLAEMCGVSVGTVDRALHHRGGIKRETAERILALAREHGYIEEKEARRLVGVVVFDLYNRYFSELLMRLDAEARKQGYSLTVMFTDKDAEKERECIHRLYAMGVDGIVLCPIGEGNEFVRFLQSLHLPVVTVGNRLPEIPHVGVDDRVAMYDAAAALGKSGTQIVYYAPALRGKGNRTAQTERLAGYLAYAEEHQFSPIVIDREAALDAVLNQNPMAAVLCSTDFYMLQVVLRYPMRRVMGFDGLDDLPPRCLTLDGAIGEVAKESLAELIAQKAKNRVIAHRIRE